MNAESRLSIWLEDKQVGELQLDTTADTLSLNYTPAWQVNGFALSPHLPLNNPIEPVAVQRFLCNLFPEGNSFEAV